MRRDQIASSFDQAYANQNQFFGSKVRSEFAEWSDRNPVADLRVLDVGCGDGRYSLYLAERGAVVTAVDFSEVGLAKLRRAATLRKLNIDTARMDLCTDPLPAGDFDLITVDTVLGHLDDMCRERLAAGLYISLRVGGILYASAFTVADPGYNSADATNGTSELASTAVHYFAADEMGLLFADFRQVSYREFMEESRAHGAPHMHGYAVGFFTKH